MAQPATDKAADIDGVKGTATIPLLRTENLVLHYRTERGAVRAVDGIDLTLAAGEAMVILGESGCGKSSLTKALLRMLPRNVAAFSGSVWFEGRDIMTLDEETFRREVRWVGISMVMQAAMNALNPVVRVGDQVAEPLRVHRGWSRARALEKAAETFALVGLPADFLTRYPFEMSGGMRQRAVLAMALVTDPRLVILDEPTSALDVLTQANIMNVLKRIKAELGTSFILITHDVATSSELANRVALMYGGQLVEVADAAHFFRTPSHPYSELLMASVPRLRDTHEPVHIPGQPPNLLDLPAGCRFADRCPKRFARCAEPPPQTFDAAGNMSRCWLADPAHGSGAR
ncbi:MAG: ABC transporter ATP-binding protein [Pseudomonadales bacterium]|nr:ABC transporter ATP-binding protein [Pseudomonadales bacterium]